MSTTTTTVATTTTPQIKDTFDELVYYKKLQVNLKPEEYADEEKYPDGYYTIDEMYYEGAICPQKIEMKEEIRSITKDVLILTSDRQFVKCTKECATMCVYIEDMLSSLSDQINDCGYTKSDFMSALENEPLDSLVTIAERLLAITGSEKDMKIERDEDKNKYLNMLLQQINFDNIYILDYRTFGEKIINEEENEKMTINIDKFSYDVLFKYCEEHYKDTSLVAENLNVNEKLKAYAVEHYKNYDIERLYLDPDEFDEIEKFQYKPDEELLAPLDFDQLQHLAVAADILNINPRRTLHKEEPYDPTKEINEDNCQPKITSVATFTILRMLALKIEKECIPDGEITPEAVKKALKILHIDTTDTKNMYTDEEIAETIASSEIIIEPDSEIKL